MGGLHVDPMNHSVWCATDPARRTLGDCALGRAGKIARTVHGTRTRSARSERPVLRGQGEIYVTDTDGNKVYGFDRKPHRFASLELSRAMFYPNGITLTDDGKVLYVADFLGVQRMDLRSNEAEEVKPAAYDTLAGADGLYWYKDTLVGIQNSASLRRVMRWQLSGDGRSMVASRSAGARDRRHPE